MTSSIPLPTLVVFFDHTAKMGGGEVALLHLVTHLDRKRFEPVVILAQDGELRDWLARVGVEVHVLLLGEDVGEVRKDALGGARSISPGQIAQVARYVWKLSRFLRARGARVLHTNSLKADVLGVFAGKLAGVPTVWHVRDRIADDYLPARAARLFRLACRVLPSFVIANSHATMQTLELPASKAASNRVVHDGLPPALFDSVGASTHNSQAPIIALVGRISPWKGQDVFLKAAAQVVQHFPGARFQIIGAPLFGEQEWETHLRALCTSLGLDESVEWLGFRRDVPELVAGCDLLVHASTTGEPFGQVVVEAMLCARPVVATNGGGIPEIVRDGETGLLVPMNDADAMARAIETLLSDPAKSAQMGQSGLERARTHFSIARTAADVEGVYDAMLDRGQQTSKRNRWLLPVLGGIMLGVNLAQRRKRRTRKGQ